MKACLSTANNPSWLATLLLDTNNMARHSSVGVRCHPLLNSPNLPATCYICLSQLAWLMNLFKIISDYPHSFLLPGVILPWHFWLANSNRRSRHVVLRGPLNAHYSLTEGVTITFAVAKIILHIDGGWADRAVADQCEQPDWIWPTDKELIYNKLPDTWVYNPVLILNTRMGV